MLIFDKNLSLDNNREDYNNKWKDTIVLDKQTDLVLYLGEEGDPPEVYADAAEKGNKKAIKGVINPYEIEILPINLPKIQYMYLNRNSVGCITRAHGLPFKRSLSFRNLKINYVLSDSEFGITATFLESAFIHGYKAFSGKTPDTSWPTVYNKLFHNNISLSYKNIHKILYDTEHTVKIVNKYLCIVKSLGAVQLHSSGIKVYDSRKSGTSDSTSTILDKIMQWKELTELN